MKQLGLDFFPFNGTASGQSSDRSTSAHLPFPYISCFVSIPCDTDKIDIHWHRDMEFILIREGSGTASVDLEKFEVHRGDICIILPDQLHSLEAFENETLKAEIINFPLEMLTSQTPSDGTDQFFSPLQNGEQIIPWHITPDVSWYDAFIQCIREIDQICTFYPAAYPLAVKSRLFQMFYIMFYSKSKVPPKSRPLKSVQKTKLIVEYISSHYAEPLTMEMMASVCGFSESHFMKFIRSTLDTTFTDCLNNYRIAMAASMLISGSRPVSEIALSCGFENISYFNRLFKRRYGETPTAFRKQEI